MIIPKKIMIFKACGIVLLSAFTRVHSDGEIQPNTKVSNANVRRRAIKKQAKSETTRQRHERADDRLPGCVPHSVVSERNFPAGIDNVVINYYYAIESQDELDDYTVSDMEMFLLYVLNSAIFWCPTTMNSNVGDNSTTSEDDGDDGTRRLLHIKDSEIVQNGKLKINANENYLCFVVEYA